MQSLFICTLFTFTILATKTKTSDSEQQVKPHFAELEKHIHQSIFKYLNLSEQGIYSSLNQRLHHIFRKPFLILRTWELLFGFRPANMEHRPENTTLQQRSLALLNDTTGFKASLKMLLNLPSTSYTDEEMKIMTYVNELKQAQRLIYWITFTSLRPNLRIRTPDELKQTYTDFFYLFNLQTQTLYSSMDTNFEPGWTQKEKITTMPLVVHYLVNDQVHVDFFAEYPKIRFTDDPCAEEMEVAFTSQSVDFSQLQFYFTWNKKTNTMTEVTLMVTNTAQAGSNNNNNNTGEPISHADDYLVENGVLARATWHLEAISIQSIITSSSFIEIKK